MSVHPPIQGSEVFIARRRRLAARLELPAALFAGDLSPRNYAANTHPYRAHSHFLYFTGVERGTGAPEGRAWRHLFDAHTAGGVGPVTRLKRDIGFAGRSAGKVRPKRQPEAEQEHGQSRQGARQESRTRGRIG